MTSLVGIPLRMPASSLGKKRLVGLAILVIILSVFFSLNRFPKLDTVREDLEAVTGPKIECFQGFCIEREDDSTLLERWWKFSLTYLQLVALGMLFAFTVAGLSEAFLFPRSSGVGILSGGSIRRSLKGLIVGPVMNLCSACIVPVSSSFQRQGVGIEGALAILHGSSTLNVPGLVMAALVFTPILGISRFILGITAVILVGPLVAYVVERGTKKPDEEYSSSELELDVDTIVVPDPWLPAMREAFLEWVKTSFRFLIRMGPVMVLAGFASGLAMQWFSPDVVSTYLGNDVLGVAVAATFGILINVPLLFEIPLVALLLLLGMGEAPAATLLFTAAAGGPVTFWGLASSMPKKAIATLAFSTWTLGLVGGAGILIAGLFVSENLVALKISTEEDIDIPAAITLDKPVFKDVTSEAGINFLHTIPDSQLFPLGAGVVVFDYNGDGIDDFFIANMRQPNVLYRNNGDGTFTDVARQSGLDDSDSETNGGCAADYDNDGDHDIYTTIHGANKLFNNDGTGIFTDVSASAIDTFNDKRRFSGCAWGDYDADGHLDLITVSHLGEAVEDLLIHRDFGIALRGLSLFHNNGDGTFSNVTTLLGDTSGPSMGGVAGNIYGAGFQPAWFDYDNDGDIDLYVVNDIGREIQPNVLWRNDGMGPDGWVFKDVSIELDADIQMDGMGVAIGDYDMDGRFDLFITNINDSVLLKNSYSNPLDIFITDVNQDDSSDDGKFVDTAAKAGAEIGLIGRKPRIGWGTMFMDYDNDSDEDLYVVSGWLDAPQPINSKEQPNALLRNDGLGVFTDVSDGSGAADIGIGRGGAYFDYDGDGCLDIMLANYGQSARLFRNVCDTGNSWLIVKLNGQDSNRDGIGARVNVNTERTSQIRLISAGSSSMGQNMISAHFGLGDTKEIKSLVIRWPSGTTQTFENVKPNQVLIVKESD